MDYCLATVMTNIDNTNFFYSILRMQRVNENIEALIEEYPPNYCASLEAVYGEGMMSEGGEAEIKAMIQHLDLTGKTVLDFGCGLGGVSLYLAKHFDCQVYGIDINPHMIEKLRVNYSKLTAKEAFAGQLKAMTYSDSQQLPFDTESIDIIISKGVLTHVQYKTIVFNEFHRVLKMNGQLCINDWLSSVSQQWGWRVQRMIEIEGLSIHAVAVDDYKALLTASQFEIIDHMDVSAKYAAFNQQIVQYLSSEAGHLKFATTFTEELCLEYIESYQAIADAMSGGELQVHNCIAVKK